MDLILPKKYGRQIWRAIMEFEMVSPGDRCLVGLSGGKDSSFLLYALAILRRHAPFQFDLAAVTIDPMFDPRFPTDRLASLCQELDVPFYLERMPLAEMILAPGAQNPCPKCAYFRRGALNRLAQREGYNRLALAHHHDDAVETFLMSVMFSGQIKTFTPVTPQDDGVTVIRPLIYLREQEIKAARKFFPFEPVASGCPVDGHSSRQNIKELIRSAGKDNPMLYANLTAAMRNPSDRIELWPPEPSREEMHQRYLRLFGSRERL